MADFAQPIQVLLVEDEASVAEPLAQALRRGGFVPTVASTAAGALQAARRQQFDFVILDLTLPDGDGRDVCREIRRDSSVPLIMLTARGTELDKIVGLELGADDYITKPFSVREVVARVNAVLRRSRSEGERTVPERDAFGNFSIDRAARRVMLEGQEVRLTTREFDLLSHLLASSGRVQSRERLLQQVWGENFSGESKTVDVHIRWLREKFATVAPFQIVTVRGAGYRLDRPSEPAENKD